MRAVMQIVAIAALLAVLVNAAQARALSNAPAETATVKEIIPARFKAHVSNAELREKIFEKEDELVGGDWKAFKMAEAADASNRERRSKSSKDSSDSTDSTDSTNEDIIDAAVEIVTEILDAIKMCEDAGFPPEYVVVCTGAVLVTGNLPPVDSG